MSPRLLLVVLLAAVAAAQANTTTAQVVTTTTPLATSTAAQTTSTAAQTTSSAAQTTSAQSAATTTTSAQQTTVPGAPWSGEQAAGARRFAKQQVALVSVRLVRSSGTGNATVISELAAASFLVEVDRQAQLSLPGSWASAGGSEAQVQVVLLWNKTGVNYTATATLPSPFASSGLSVAYYEAWVGLNAGVPEVVTWQTQCNGATVSSLPADQCSLSSCVSSFCGLSTLRCNSTSSNSTSSACDVRVYLAWRGPDAANQLCTSFALLPSNFALFSAAGLVSVLTGSWSDFVYGMLNAAAPPATALALLAFALAALL